MQPTNLPKPTMFYDLLTIPDPRPSKAHPQHRAARKAVEQEFPHFDAKDLGLKAGVLALMLGIACYPRIKAEQDALEHAAKLKEKEKQKDMISYAGKQTRLVQRSLKGAYLPQLGASVAPAAS
ncbi:hypothetical protein IFR05_005151 [Cadophora sp. M221]|nr:hypothetical protein IFR05_005151 [Cadophora sp. M221]